MLVTRLFLPLVLLGPITLLCGSVNFDPLCLVVSLFIPVDSLGALPVPPFTFLLCKSGSLMSAGLSGVHNCSFNKDELDVSLPSGVRYEVSSTLMGFGVGLVGPLVGMGGSSYMSCVTKTASFPCELT